MALTVGVEAPDFQLASGDGRVFTLSEMRGHVVVLNFYPADSSMVCTKQMCSYNDSLDGFERADALVLGISPQGERAKQRFAEKHDLKIPLLIDEGSRVARAYGLGGLGGQRATFVIDREGRISWVFNSLTALRFASTEEILRQIEAAA